jgi:secreted trypsin-like serine protease
MVFNTTTKQYYQVGMVSGGVSTCGDKLIPGYYTRLDYPKIANFIQNPENFPTLGIFAKLKLSLSK